MPIGAGWGTVIGSTVAVGGSMAASAMMGGGDGASFAPRNLYQEITDTQRAQEETAGAQFALRAQYDPLYEQLKLDNTKRLLLGGQGGERVEYYNDYTQPKQVATGNYINRQTGQTLTAQQYQNALGGNKTLYEPEYRTEGGFYQTRQRMVPTERTDGLLSVLGEVLPEVDKMTAASTERQRQMEVDSLTKFGPEYLAALQGANPEQTALRNRMMEQANQQLDGGLSPFEQRQFQQNFRSAASGRLGDTGLSGAGAETYFLQAQADARKRQAQQFAQSLIAQDQAIYGDPFLQITGRSSGSLPASQSILGAGQSIGANSGAPSFDPFNSYAQDVYNTNSNGQNAANIAAGNRSAGLITGGLGAFGNIYEGALKAGVFNRQSADPFQGGGGQTIGAGNIYGG